MDIEIHLQHKAAAHQLKHFSSRSSDDQALSDTNQATKKKFVMFQTIHS
uniref:Uncharacterized protein n=1 Tax=Arundo donax TaxID=35708 RepID=A0A0A9AMJ1_ARUDO